MGPPPGQRTAPPAVPAAGEGPVASVAPEAVGAPAGAAPSADDAPGRSAEPDAAAAPHRGGDGSTPGEASADVGRPVGTFAAEAAIRPDVVPRLFRLPVLAGCVMGRAIPETVLWLDTADAILAAAGVLEERPGHGPPARVTLSARGAPVRPGDLPEAGTAPLLPLAGWEGRRREGVLASPEGPVTITLRWGRVRAAAAEAEHARLRLDGPASALRRILEALAEDAEARPVSTSLAAEGLALSLGRPTPTGEPDAADPTDLDSLAASVLDEAADALMHHAATAAVESGPEAVHRMRVAIRRLRAGLRALRPVADCGETEALAREAAALARLLGPARDLDVFLAGIAASVADATDGGGGPDARIVSLLRRGAVRRAEAYASLRTALDGPGFRRLLWSLRLTAMERPWRRAGEPAPPAKAHAAAVLGRAWRRTRRRAKRLGDPPNAAALHEVRLAAKGLRYGARLFAPLWPAKASRRFLGHLSALQDALGEANDAAVAREVASSLVARDSRRAWAAGLVEGWALADAGRARRRAAKAWRRMRRAAPFWAASAPGGSA